jgi:hypothetical protein
MLPMRYVSPTLNVFLNAILFCTGSQQFIISCISLFSIINFFIYARLIGRKISTYGALSTQLCMNFTFLLCIIHIFFFIHHAKTLKVIRFQEEENCLDGLYK